MLKLDSFIANPLASDTAISKKIDNGVQTLFNLVRVERSHGHRKTIFGNKVVFTIDEIESRIEDAHDLLVAPLTKLLGVVPRINSWYRAPQLNDAVGGSSSSWHMTGNAIDFDEKPDSYSNKHLAGAVLCFLFFDELILETAKSGHKIDWVHVAANAKKNRFNIKQKLPAAAIPEGWPVNSSGKYLSHRPLTLVQAMDLLGIPRIRKSWIESTLSARQKLTTKEEKLAYINTIVES